MNFLQFCAWQTRGGGISYQHMKRNVEQRLNIAKGQIEALNKMVSKGEDCRKVVEQFSAVESALKNAVDFYLQDHLDQCMAQLDENSKKELKSITDTLVKHR